MNRIVRVTLDVHVSDMSLRERNKCAILGMCKEKELPTLADVDDEDIRYLFDNLHPDTLKEMLAGSMMFIKFDHIEVV